MIEKQLIRQSNEGLRRISDDRMNAAGLTRKEQNEREKGESEGKINMSTANTLFNTSIICRQ